ncbi:cation diffusion facilitator family transporter [Streptococcus sp. DD13]|uniref:cation diffusion facilitator family transporter n=1 Tax=Streptococcus sp. DD13 TaxID=1777881 RepID=UPI0007996106|nr:cation diffusion facilitator family transporter [Streptococcus sp. DD13]KXT78248.1 Cobalt-zinc-cadmium resistance protein CzcD [Streptococcus sp. DD13]
MKSYRNILIAFFLNFSFAIIEVIFGSLFHSSAVLSDAVHDLGDAIAIGASAYLEGISNREEDHHYTLGYKRFSLLGAIITGLILIIGSTFVILENIPKLLHPEVVNYNGTLWLGIIAITINLLASLMIRKGQTKNEAVLSLHFLEDILGWLAVILVSLILHITDWYILDPLLSLAISGFILSKSLPSFWKNLKIFLAAVPEHLNLEKLLDELKEIPNIQAVNQVSVWSMDGLENHAIIHVTLHDVHQGEGTKKAVRTLCRENQISTITIEFDQSCKEHDLHKRKPLTTVSAHHHAH